MRGVNAATKTVIAMVDLRKGETSMVGQWDKHTSSQHVSQLKRRHVWQRLSVSRFSIFFQPSFRKSMHASLNEMLLFLLSRRTARTQTEYVKQQTAVEPSRSS